MPILCSSHGAEMSIAKLVILNPSAQRLQQSQRHATAQRSSCISCRHVDTRDARAIAALPFAKQISIPAALLISEVCCNSAIADEAVAKYVPGPVEVGPEIWVGAIAATIPFVIGSWEFAKRIIIQRRCQKCEGSGLVMRGRFARKCPECGGFFPWQGWRRFFTSTALPGNGGPLRQPRGQTSIFYKVPEDPRKSNGSQLQSLSTDAQQESEKDDVSAGR